MKLSATAVQDRLQQVNSWLICNNAIEKKYVFKSFKEAMVFINKVAVIADEMNHHPEWINVYNKLTIRLSTHDVSGITDKDFQLASAIDAITV
jgi:4a-hydroxytetrahydrobiopterin dehydratase